MNKNRDELGATERNVGDQPRRQLLRSMAAEYLTFITAPVAKEVWRRSVLTRMSG